ncbi:MAG: hypothetical protein DDT32_00913 [Syntrophomonadaceae bacterium]|nr:hypothetical protein [Bacillota bacterium]
MYETLLREAQEQKVEVVYRTLKGKIKGLYSDQVIAISNSIVITVERACILAEELSHYHTTVGDILDQTKLQNRKQELRARTWSYQRLVPLGKVMRAAQLGIRTRFELAEYFHVTESFLEAAIKYYKEKHGVYCRVGEYYICFEPLGVLKISEF